MQSGRARSHEWVLEFESARAKRPDPLTGWAGGAETQEQIRLVFPTSKPPVHAARKAWTTSSRRTR